MQQLILQLFLCVSLLLEEWTINFNRQMLEKNSCTLVAFIQVVLTANILTDFFKVERVLSFI